MKFSNFIIDKSLQLVLIISALVTIEIFLLAYNIGNFIKIYIPVIILSMYFISIFIEFYIKNKYYKKIFQLLNYLEEKYLITEIIEYPNFVEGKAFYEALKEINKSMLENVNNYKYLQDDYKEYIEMWIHEIKIPIATSKMIIENNKTEVTISIDEELEKIENYIEQALYYSRSNTVEKDYYIKKNNLKEIVNEVILKNKKVLITNKIAIDTHDLERVVRTDNKWLVFILNQIIQNSIKYRKPKGQSEIEIYSKQGKENVILFVKDNGMGIKKGEITRVYDKGFTGTNGRTINKRSTGIGLYLCKKLCDKLGIGLDINSAENEWTEVKIIFPENSYIDFDKDLTKM